MVRGCVTRKQISSNHQATTRPQERASVPARDFLLPPGRPIEGDTAGRPLVCLPTRRGSAAPTRIQPPSSLARTGQAGMGAAAVASSNRPDTAGPGPDRQIAPKTGHCSILLLSGLDCMYVIVLQVSGSRWYYCFTVFPPIFLFWVRVNGLQCDLLVTGTCRRRQMYHLEEGKKISGKKREEKKHLGFCYDHVPDPSNASEIRKVSRAPGISKSNATYKSNQQVYL